MAQTGTLGTLSQGIGALIMGQVVGSASEFVTTRLSMYKGELGLDMSRHTFFDFIVDLLVEVSMLTIGTTFVERAMPSVTTDLHSLMFYIIGLSMTQRRMARNLNTLRNTIMGNQEYPREPAIQDSTASSAGDSPYIG